MFLCRWDFTLIALAVTPLLAVFVFRVNKAITSAVKEVRTHQSDLLSTLQEGLQSIQVVQAFGREDHQAEQVRKVSENTVAAWLNARRVSSMLSPAVEPGHRGVHRPGALAGFTAHHGRRDDDGALTVYLAYLAKFFQPVRDLAQMTNTIAQVSVAFERVRAVNEADTVIREHPSAKEAGPFRGEIAFEHVGFGYDPQLPVLSRRHVHHQPGPNGGHCRSHRQRQIHRSSA